MPVCAVSQEIAEALGSLSSDSSEEEVLTTRVVRRRVIIQVGVSPGSWASLPPVVNLAPGVILPIISGTV